ncbi:MAG TPA: acetyl-CoA C-acyltransferase [Trueperaceae bacterium]|nr:acetyl-CoA C-acyltransferase [Trueperaceae bacterium]
MSVRDAYLVAALRTPVGRHGGALASVRPDDLAAAVLSEIVERAGVPGRDIADVVLGCANQAGEDNRNVARMAALLAGYPVSVPGVTVNRLCGSGLDAVAQAARGVKLGEGELYVGGGVESMSRAPWALPKPEKGYATGSTTVYDTSLGWRFVNPRMAEEYGTESMGETAENLAEERDVSRDEQDAYALASHRKATAAIAADRFAEEIVPVRVVSRRQTTVVDTDEGPRTDTNMEALGRLRPAFREGGTVTAGNSSTLNDGAAAVLVASREYAEAHGLTPLARVVSTSVVGVPPRIMGIGPAPATRAALERAGMSLDDVGLIELNEAFAAQTIAVLRDLGLDVEDARVNPNGGAIALGHPLGCSGARILTTLLHEMVKTDVDVGLATMCIGVGQGIAMIVERV